MALAGAALHPARSSAKVSISSAGFDLAPTSAIIWPLLEAVPKICGSKGTTIAGSVPTERAKSPTGISGRLATPTWLRISRGGRSLGRAVLRKSIRFLVLRRLASSGVAVTMTSSAWTRVALVQGAQEIGDIDDHVGNGQAHHIENVLQRVLVDRVVSIDRAWGGKKRQTVAGLGKQAVEKCLVDTLRLAERLGDALGGVDVEIEPGGAEGKIEIGDDRVDHQPAREQPADIVGDGARADAALGADKGEDAADLAGLGIGIEGADRLDDVKRPKRCHEIFAHPRTDQLAIEQDVIDMADDDDLGRGIADIGEMGELGQYPVASAFGLDHQDVRRRVSP